MAEDTGSLEYWLKLGKEFNLVEGEKLLKWAEKKLAEAVETIKQKRERDEKIAERNRELAQIEAENTKAKLDIESRKIESEERIKMKQLEVEMAKKRDTTETCKSYLPKLKLLGLNSGSKDSAEWEVIIDIFEREAREIGLDDKFYVKNLENFCLIGAVSHGW